MKKRKNGLNAEELKKHLGACNDCGWKRGKPIYSITGPEWNEQAVVRIYCKAVNNGKDQTRPQPNLVDSCDCKHRKRAIEKRERNPGNLGVSNQVDIHVALGAT